MKTTTDTQTKMQDILMLFAQQVAALVRQDIGRQLMGTPLRHANGHKNGHTKKAKGNIKPCKIPGCGKPSKGPRFKFLCEEHRDMPKSQLAKLLAKAA